MYEAIREHIPFLRSHAEALAGSAVGAEDLLREMLLHALAKSHQVGPNTDLRGWLFTILHNQHTGRARRTCDARSGGRGGEACETGSDADLDARRLGQALALLPDAHRRLMTIVASENGLLQSNGDPAPTGHLNQPASRRLHPKTTVSSRCLAEPTRRLPGRPRLAAASELRRR